MITMLSLLTFSFTVLCLFYSYARTNADVMDWSSIYWKGHFEIASSGYWEETLGQKPSMSKEVADQMIRYLEEDEDILLIMKETDFMGLIGNEEGSNVIIGTGIEPDKASYGGSASYASIESGRRLLKNDLDGVLLGRTAARLLDLHVNDGAVIMGSTESGALNMMQTRIVGTIYFGYGEMDKMTAFAPIELVNYLNDSDDVDRILVFINGMERVPWRLVKDKIDKVKDYIGKNNLDLSVQDWKSLTAESLGSIKELYLNYFYFVAIILTITMFFSSFLHSTNNFLERFQEIGALRSVGTYRHEIFLMLFIEVLLLLVLTFVLGSVASHLLASGINSLHLEWTPPGNTKPVPILLNMTPEVFLLPLLTIGLASLLSSVLPVVKSARMNLIEVLNHV